LKAPWLHELKLCLPDPMLIRKDLDGSGDVKWLRALFIVILEFVNSLNRSAPPLSLW